MPKLDPAVRDKCPKVFADPDANYAAYEFAITMFRLWQWWQSDLERQQIQTYQQEIDAAFIEHLQIMIFG